MALKLGAPGLQAGEHVRTRDKVYAYIIQESQNGRVPTFLEICRAVGLKHKSTAHYHLERLVERGLIEREIYSRRGIRVINAGKDPSSMNTVKMKKPPV